MTDRFLGHDVEDLPVPNEITRVSFPVVNRPLLTVIAAVGDLSNLTGFPFDIDGIIVPGSHPPTLGEGLGNVIYHADGPGSLSTAVSYFNQKAKSQNKRVAPGEVVVADAGRLQEKGIKKVVMPTLTFLEPNGWVMPDSNIAAGLTKAMYGAERAGVKSLATPLMGLGQLEKLIGVRQQANPLDVALGIVLRETETGIRRFGSTHLPSNSDANLLQRVLLIIPDDDRTSNVSAGLRGMMRNLRAPAA